MVTCAPNEYGPKLRIIVASIVALLRVSESESGPGTGRSAADKSVSAPSPIDE